MEWLPTREITFRTAVFNGDPAGPDPGNPVQHEAVIELSYRIQPARDWSMQPDLQYIIHPGGNVANPYVPGGVTPIPNAFVLGWRTQPKF
jgi:porin